VALPPLARLACRQRVWTIFVVESVWAGALWHSRLKPTNMSLGERLSHLLTPGASPAESYGIEAKFACANAFGTRGTLAAAPPNFSLGNCKNRPQAFI
jgi:hypothetical protein